MVLVLLVGLSINAGMASDDNDPFGIQSVPFMEYGGLIERTLRSVPVVHDRIWKLQLEIFC